MSRKLLKEGGVAGHMSHLYDNPELTFSKMKELFQAAAQGKLVGTEKTDGQNLFITYDLSTGKAKAARNKGNIKAGGMDAAGLAAKFKGRGNLEAAFNDAFAAFETAAQRIPQELQLKIFGQAGDIYYNAEVQDPRSANVINYDEPNLVIHQVGHAQFNKETGKVVDADVSKNADYLFSALEDLQQKREKGKFLVQRNALRKLKALSDDTILKQSLSRLEAALNAAGVSDNQTVVEYIIARLRPVIDAENIPFTEEQYGMFLKKLFGVKGLYVLKISQDLEKEDKAKVKKLLKMGPTLLKDAIRPIEDIVHDFSVEMLKGLESVFVVDNAAEVERLRGKLKNAINAIEASEDEERIGILNKQMSKLKDIESVSTAAEGFVFDFDGYTYKFTGNFAPMNQILGLFKFGRGKAPALVDKFLSPDATKGEAEFFYAKQEPEQPYLRETDEIPMESHGIIVLYPGGFKPPHAGHFEMMKRYSEDPEVGKVIVLLGKKQRTSKDGTIFVDKEKTIHIISEFYKQYLSEKVVIEDAPAGEENPMRAAYKWVEENSKSGETYTLAASSKDPERAVQFARGHCHPEGKYCQAGVEVVLHPADTAAVVYKGRTDNKNGKEISASVMREDLANGDKANFMTNLPIEVKDNVDEIYDFLKGATEEEPSVYDLIDKVVEETLNDKLEEFSSMGGGSVAFAGSGPPGSGPPIRTYKRDKQRKRTNYKRKPKARKKNMSEEKKLRKLIRNRIEENLKGRRHKLNEEKKLRKIIRKLVLEAAIEDSPTKSTGINKLVGALKIVLPTIERAYKSLTTSIEQRESFKKHITKAFIDTLSPQDALASAGEGDEIQIAEPDEALQEQTLDIDIEPDPTKMIDVDNPKDPFGEKAAEDAVAAATEEDDKRKSAEAFEDVEGDEREFPALPGLDETGRDEAVDVYKKTIDAIVRTYRRLHNETDRGYFKDYLVTNLLLYFDKWEGDISPELGDISTPEYEKQKQNVARFDMGAGEALQEEIKSAILETIKKEYA